AARHDPRALHGALRAPRGVSLTAARLAPSTWRRAGVHRCLRCRARVLAGRCDAHPADVPGRRRHGARNALMPVAVKERFADRPVFATGVYAAGINVGATSSAAAAVPLAHALDSWRDPILVFSAVSIGLAVLWLAFTRIEREHRGAAIPRPLALPWRNPFAWRLVAAFFFMSSTYYGLNAWLPDVYVERGWSEGRAGALLAVLNATQIVAGLGITWLADRMGSRRAWMAGCASILVVSLLGVVLVPSGGFLW